MSCRACPGWTAGQGGIVTDVKQPTPLAADPDSNAGADAFRYQTPRHPSRGQDTPVDDDDGRAASGDAQIGRNRSARGNGGRSDDAGRPVVQRTQPDPGESPAIPGSTHRAADYRRYRGTPHGFRAEPGPAAREGEPIPERSDAAVTRDVHDFLMRDGLLDLEELDVRVKDGCVFLHGRARTERGAYQAAELAQHVAGVREVTNNLEVSQPASTSGDR
jgi:hypothetical protein